MKISGKEQEGKARKDALHTDKWSTATARDFLLTGGPWKDEGEEPVFHGVKRRKEEKRKRLFA
ncbi:MAG: hypothetical protein ACJA16_003422 [Akkermansiaceae bacterium]|jgi:hypothetical protein